MFDIYSLCSKKIPDAENLSKGEVQISTNCKGHFFGFCVTYSNVMLVALKGFGIIPVLSYTLV